MEDTLRVNFTKIWKQKRAIVLILVLMEDTLREIEKGKITSQVMVLILVLMEDTLRES